MDHSLNTRADRDADGNYIFYHYEVSMVAAIVFVALFSAATLLPAFQMCRFRTWFMIPVVVGTAFEVAGYTGRIVGAQENPGPYSLIPYIVQTIFLLVAPALPAASIYMELGRIVLMVQGDHRLFIRRTWLTKTFVIGDVISFFMQAAGGGMQASKKPKVASFSKKVLIVGLFAQLVFFAIFVIAAGSFHVRLQRRSTPLAGKRPWKKHMLCLYLVSIFIFVRSAVRVVEYLQGTDGYIITHEVFLHAFDAAVMFLVVTIMGPIHPGEVAAYVRQTDGVYERIKGGEALRDDASV